MDAYESLAHDYLITKHLTIIESNFTWPGGEIDLIALDQQELVFIEVKFRMNTDHGHPLEFITPSKISKIKRTADYFLLNTWQGPEPFIRFDAISLLPSHIKSSSQNKDFQNTEIFKSFAIEWIKAAF